MKISQTGQYAIKLMTYLAQNEGKTVSLNEIAEHQNIPLTYIPQISKVLSSHGLITSYRGANGGLKLSRNPSECKLSEILFLTESSLVDNQKQFLNDFPILQSLNVIIVDFLTKHSLMDLIPIT